MVAELVRLWTCAGPACGVVVASVEEPTYGCPTCDNDQFDRPRQDWVKLFGLTAVVERE